MPASDKCEPQVIAAFKKEGWEVIQEQYSIRFLHSYVLADLRLQRDQDYIVVVEIKCFTDERLLLDDLYRAFGQFVIYRSALQTEGIFAPIYLAIPHPIYQKVFLQPAIQVAIQDVKMKLVTIDLVQEEVVQWQT